MASSHWFIFSYTIYPCNYGIRQHKSVPSTIACLKSNQGYKMDLWKTWLYQFLMLNYHKIRYWGQYSPVGISITGLGRSGVSCLPTHMTPDHCSHQWDWLSVLFPLPFSPLLEPCATQLLAAPVGLGKLTGNLTRRLLTLQLAVFGVLRLEATEALMSRPPQTTKLQVAELTWRSHKEVQWIQDSKHNDRDPFLLGHCLIQVTLNEPQCLYMNCKWKHVDFGSIFL